MQSTPPSTAASGPVPGTDAGGLGRPSPKPAQLAAAPAIATVTGTRYPRVVVTYCTGCRWMLRAAYFAQELLTTFSTSIGEVALSPTTGGIFRIELFHVPPREGEGGGVLLERDSATATVEKHLLWERTSETGFPETKVIKQLVRNIIEPNRSLGHSDSAAKKAQPEEPPARPNPDSEQALNADACPL